MTQCDRVFAPLCNATLQVNNTNLLTVISQGVLVPFLLYPLPFFYAFALRTTHTTPQPRSPGGILYCPDEARVGPYSASTYAAAA